MFRLTRPKSSTRDVIAKDLDGVAGLVTKADSLRMVYSLTAEC
jgi:hypothetical protein